MRRGVFLALGLWLAATTASRWQLADPGVPASEPLPLVVPSRAVAEFHQLGPSRLGYLAWVAGERLTFRFRELEAGDVIKLKAAAEPGPCTVAVELDGSPVTLWRFDRGFVEHRLVLPRSGATLSLRQGPRSCALHLSRVKRQAFLAITGRGLGEAYVVSALKPAPPAARWGQVLPPALAALGLTLLALRWRRSGAGGAWSVAGWLPLAVGASQILLAAGVAPVAHARVVYPVGTLWLAWLWPQLGAWAVLAVHRLAGVGSSMAGANRGCLGDLRHGLRALDLALWLPVRVAPSVVGGLLLGVYAAWLLFTLPQTPMEWDEVLFARAVVKFDVAAHAPHPPGYPVYVGLSKAMAALGASPVRAPQLASAVGALLALVGLGWLGALAGLAPSARVLAGLLVAALPTFAFHANLGFSDMLATGLSVVTLASLLALERAPGVRGAWAAGVLTALACGARPQAFLVLFLPWALVAWRLSRREQLSWLWALPAAVLASLAVWLPAVLVTGPQRFLKAGQHLAAWMSAHEYLSRFPAMELSRFLEDWLVRPLGSKPLAGSFWLLCGAGAFALWRSGRGRLLALLASGAGGYLLLAPWTMTAEAAVRYSLPAYASLAALAVFGLASAPKLSRIGAVLVGAWAVAAYAWTVPALTLRAAERNPVWAALEFARDRLPAPEVRVPFGLDPHAQYVFSSEPHRLRVLEGADPQALGGVWVTDDRRVAGRVWWTLVWPREPTATLARRRYLAASVVEVHSPPSGRPASFPPRAGQ